MKHSGRYRWAEDGLDGLSCDLDFVWEEIDELGVVISNMMDHGACTMEDLQYVKDGVGYILKDMARLINDFDKIKASTKTQCTPRVD